MFLFIGVKQFTPAHHVCPFICLQLSVDRAWRGRPSKNLLMSSILMQAAHTPLHFNMRGETFAFSSKVFPHQHNSSASVSLNPNIRNGILMNSRPHTSVPSLTHTDRPAYQCGSSGSAPSPHGFSLSSPKDKGL